VRLLSISSNFLFVDVADESLSPSPTPSATSTPSWIIRKLYVYQQSSLLLPLFCFPVSLSFIGPVLSSF